MKRKRLRNLRLEAIGRPLSTIVGVFFLSGSKSYGVVELSGFFYCFGSSWEKFNFGSRFEVFLSRFLFPFFFAHVRTSESEGIGAVATNWPCADFRLDVIERTGAC